MHAIETLRELDESGGMALATQLARSFLGSVHRHFETLGSALADRDARSFAQVAHSLKSSAANLGAETLSRFCRDMEACAREARLDEAAALLVHACRERDRAVEALRELVQGTA
jgi:HPt (histidine-containing phosphotransfer) domain-containing protein